MRTITIDNPFSEQPRQALVDLLRMFAELYARDEEDAAGELDEEREEQISFGLLCSGMADTLAGGGPLTMEQASTAKALAVAGCEGDVDEMAPRQRRLLHEASAALQQALDGARDEWMDAYREHLREQADTDGYVIQHVLGQDAPLALPPISYTATPQSLNADLIVVGLPPVVAHQMLSRLLDDLLKQPASDGAPLHGMVDDDRCVVALEPCPPHLQRQMRLTASLNPGFRARLVVWSDADGRHPRSQRCDPAVRAAQVYPVVPGE